MKNPTFLLIILFSFSSCVTLFNRKNMHVYINSARGAKVVYQKDYVGIKTRNQKGILHPADGVEFPIPKKHGVYIIVKRDRHKTLPVTVRKDNVEKTVNVKPVISGMFIANIWHAYPLLSFGFLVDRKNPNRFGYPRNIYIDLSNKGDNKHYYFRPLKRMVEPYRTPYTDVDFSPPIGNIYVFFLNKLQPGIGPLGGSAAINWHYSSCNFLSLEGGIVTLPTLRIGERFYSLGDTDFYETKSGWFINMKLNHVAKRFEFGYGISLWSHSGSSYYHIYPHSDEIITHNKSDIGIGACFSTYYYLKDFLAFGINYQPQAISMDNGPKLNYECAISGGIKLRLHLYTAK